MLVDVWKATRRRLMDLGVNADFVVIGDGPYRERLEASLRGEDAWFLGFRHGEELARLYSSSDMFVFPSVTDTLGQVVMEAQISGLPAIVTDEGGPCEIVEDGVTGRVIPADDTGAWVNAIVDLVTNEKKRLAMGAAALEGMAGKDINDAFEHFWNEHVRIWHQHLRGIGIDPASKQQAVGDTDPVAAV